MKKRKKASNGSTGHFENTQETVSIQVPQNEDPFKARILFSWEDLAGKQAYAVCLEDLSEGLLRAIIEHLSLMLSGGQSFNLALDFGLYFQHHPEAFTERDPEGHLTLQTFQEALLSQNHDLKTSQIIRPTEQDRRNFLM